jgi:hypothetical protein
MSRAAQLEATPINDRAPIHSENAFSRLAEEAHESFGTAQITPAPENPSNNAQVAAILDGFSLTEGTPQSSPPPDSSYPGNQNPALQRLESFYQVPEQEAPIQSPTLQHPELPTQVLNQTPELPTSQIPAGPLGQPGQPLDAPAQAQVPGAVDPLDQALLGMLAQNGDATSAQQAAFGIGQSIMSGLMDSMRGLGDSSDGSDNSGNSDGSDGYVASNDSNDSDDSDDTASDTSDSSQQDDSSSNSMPAWMQQYALAGF